MPVAERTRVRWWLVGLALLLGKAVGAAELQYPLSIAVSPSQVIYLADRNLPGIWRLTAGSLQVYFQGAKQYRTPLNAVRCVALDAAGRLLAGDSATREVYRFDEQGQPIGLTRKTPAADAAPPRFPYGQIGIPMDIAAAANGTLFVSDLEMHRIVRIAPDAAAPEEFVRVQAPRGICLDAASNLWVVSGRRLVKISPQGESTTIVEDNKFDFPHGVAVADDGTAYVSDGYARCIWKIPAAGQPAPLTSGPPLVNPVGLRLSGDMLFVVDPQAKAVFQVSRAGQVTAMPFQITDKSP